MTSRMRIARLDPAAYRPLADAAPDAALHRSLDAVIRRHLPPVTASLLAQPAPTADGAIVEWYTDLAGQPQRLGEMPAGAQAGVRDLLADRLRSLEALAERLETSDGAGTALAASLRQAVSYPGDETVFVVDGQPVLTFWGYGLWTEAAPPPPPSPVTAAAAAEPVAGTAGAPAARRVLPWWLWLLLALALAAAIAAALFGTGLLRWPPWGPDYAALLKAAEAEEDALQRRLADLRPDLRERLEQCAARDALAAAVAERDRLQGKIESLRDTLADRLERCPLEAEVRAAADQGRVLEDRLGELTKSLQAALAECRKRLDAERKAAEAKAETKAAATAVPCLGDQALDIYFLQDLTGSLKDDLPNMVRFMANLSERIGRGEFGSDVKVGLGSFTDKPIPKFGMPGHYVFKNHLSLTGDPARLTATLRTLRILDGGDVPEAQYEALLEMAGNAGNIGFRSKARKFVVLLTDAPPHVAGDWARIPLIGAPASEDGRADGNPMNEDYPSAQQVVAALRSADITPIFLVAGRALPIYQGLARQAGRGTALSISADSSNVMSVLLEGMRKTCAQ